MRVVMYVLNDVTRDSRVLREAGSLAAAGHEVTVIGSLRTPDEPEGSRESGPGFTIVRVAIPQGQPWWMGYVRAPWRSLPPAMTELRRALRAGRWPRALALAAGVVLSLPWVALRGAWYAIVNRLLGRPVRLSGLEYLRRWRVETHGWCRSAVAHAPRADVHHAHDMEALPAARAAARRDRTAYVYDSHEVFMAWGRILQQPRWLRLAMAAWERRMAHQAAAVVTVNEGVARELERRLAPRRLVVLHNCPPRWQPPDRPEDRIRRAATIAADAGVVLCHGGFQPGRGLSETAEAMCLPGLEAAHLVFLGYGSAILGPILADPRLAGRVHYLPAVPPDEVVAWVAGADVDTMLIAATDLNKYLSTPNKLFESLAAGVPIVASDFPEMRRVVADVPGGALGVLCDPADPAAIASGLRSILDAGTPEREALRARCLRAAHERWNWETESRKLLELYAQMEGAA
jgi:glycosyltransferase involved in cell wall biosynthesis